MKKMKRILSVIVCMLIMSQTVMAAESAVPETPSLWAIYEIQFADAYKIGDANSYTNYRGDVVGGDFLAAQSSLEKIFQVEDPEKVTSEQAITRNDVIIELYDVIEQVLALEEQEGEASELTYFIKNGMILGRTGGDYALDQPCKKEELLLLAKRVYDHLAYQLDLDGKGAFWKVSDEDNTVYLLGSIHVADGTIYPLNDKAVAGLMQSDALVVEANIVTPNPEDIAYTQQLSMLPDGQTIDQLISKETYDKFVKIVESLGMSKEIYNKLKPWSAALVLQQVQLANQQYNANMGVDVFFTSLAMNFQKPIIELEGMRYQMDMFDNFSPELQESYLTGVMDGEELSSDIVEGLLSAWKDGDVEKLASLLNADEDTSEADKEFNDKVFHIRNANMLIKVKEMLEEADKNYFVVVGAGHMVNDTGIVKGLRDAGYEVEQVK